MKINQSKTTLILFTSIVLLLNSGVACSQKSDSDSTAQTETVAENREDTLPDGFPDIVPVYQPSSITSVNEMQTAGQKMYIIGFTAESSKEEVVTFYRNELSSNGWSINPVSSGDRFSATNGELTITASILQAGSSTVFTITTPGK